MSSGPKKALSLLLSVALVVSAVPTAALAEGLDELTGGLQVVTSPAPAEEHPVTLDGSSPTVLDGQAEVGPDTFEAQGEATEDRSSDLLEAQSYADDPFCFKDVETGEIATTLHTSRTYIIMHPDGTNYTEWEKPVFEYVGTNPRDTPYGYDLNVKTVYTSDDSDEVSMLVLDGISEETYASSNWSLPTGSYRVRKQLSDDYLSQRYRVINDGVFQSHFYFSTDPNQGNNHEFSVKPYSEGKSDEDYDGGQWTTDDQGNGIYAYNTPDIEPFALAGDTRLKLWVSTAVDMDEDNKPQLESIGLWKADESLEELNARYEDIGDYDISRAVPDGQLPSWPNCLNFAEGWDDKVTNIWQRGDSDLGERFAFPDYVSGPGATSTDGYFIVDRANFANAVAEDGLYFPIVTMSYKGETYTHAYYPIEVSADATSQRNDPRITTTKLGDAQVGDAYTARLKASSGTVSASTFAWAVTDGALPAGLSINAQTGEIAGTPAQAGVYTFTITLTETTGGEARTASRDFAINVRPAASADTAFDQLSLGDIGYDHGPIWLPETYGVAAYTNLRIPISLDLRDERYNLGETELWYMVKMLQRDDDAPCYYVWHDRAADLISDDGSMLEVAVPVKKGLLADPISLTRIRAFLIPKTNDGSIAFDPGALKNAQGEDFIQGGAPFSIEPIFATLAQRYGSEPSDAVISDDGSTTESQSYRYMAEDGQTTDGGWVTDAHYDLPDMPYTAVEKPDISFGSWVHFPGLSFEGSPGDWSIARGRIRLWSYDGTTKPTNQQVKALQTSAGTYNPDDAGATFKLAPGTYAFIAEGEVPVYDDNGVETGEVAYVDVAADAARCQKLKNTAPQQYLFTIGPSEGTRTEPQQIELSYTDERAYSEEVHSLTALFETEDGGYAKYNEAMDSGNVEYQTAWYRRTGADESSDILVATGDYVTFGPSDYDLYVEVTPTGRGNSFWRGSERIKVSDKNKAVTVHVPRKQLFKGTFTLSCESGKTPAEGDTWGILEVRTPLTSGGYTSYNTWSFKNVVTLPDLTSGSIVTYTPATKLDAGPVEYVVPEDADGAFTANLVAPLPKGMITFEGLSFTDVDGETSDIALDDATCGVEVQRVVRNAGMEDYTTDVPFYLSDGLHLVLQPERYYGNYFENHNETTTYRITVTYRDPSAPEKMGVELPDYAARQTFEVSLSPDVTAATVDEATLASRGYAVVPLANPGNKACTLLLYRNTGYTDDNKPEGTLIDKDSSIAATQTRTPFLEPGTYTLYAVDVNLLRHKSYDRISQLRDDILTGDNAQHASYVSFIVEEGKAIQTRELTYPVWDGGDLIDRVNSKVDVSVGYGSNVSITMHAVIAEGMKLSDDAYLEISTNQPSGNWGQGYMGPKALSFNGHALQLNRWENLFDQTQCMGDGSIKILLSEVQRLMGEGAGRIMDMHLIVPRTRTEYAEASVWIVSDRGSKRALVGTSRHESHEVTLSAPTTVAWESFYVSGETGPDADVVVYMNGMRAGTGRADEYGYYTAEVTLPPNPLDFSNFTLQAVSQWSTEEGDIFSASSDVQDVTYTNSYPVVERVTMCYQSTGPDDTYNDVVTYNRGIMPNKYLSLYRAEQERNSDSDDHAKYFFLVEFANGDAVSDVQISVPRSASTTSLTSTDVLKTAESWIEDVKTGIQYSSPAVLGGTIAAKSPAGQRVRDALLSDETHAFVTQPAYFSYAPDEIAVDFDCDYSKVNFTQPMMPVANPGRFEGFKSCDSGDLTSFIGSMGTKGNVLVCGEAELQALENNNGLLMWDDQPNVSISQLKTDAGNIDQWLLLGSDSTMMSDPNRAAAIERNSILKVRHQISTVDMGTAAIRSEVQGVINEAQRVIGPYESWLYDDGPLPTGEAARYNGRGLAYATGARTTESDSLIYLIGTVDEDENVQFETFETFYIEDTDSFCHLRICQDGEKLVMTSYDEENGQKVTVTYTIAPDQVDEHTGFNEVWTQWAYVMYAVMDSFNVAAGDSDATGLQSPLVGQSEGANGGDLLFAQNVFTDFAGEIAGIFGGTARDSAAEWVGKEAVNVNGPNEINEGTVPSLRKMFARDTVDDVNALLDKQQANPNAKPIAQQHLKAAVKAADTGVKTIAVETAVNAGSALAGGPGVKMVKNVAVGVAAAPVTKGLAKSVKDSLDRNVANRRKKYKRGESWAYDLYWQAKWRETKGQWNLLWFFRHLSTEATLKDFQGSWSDEYDKWRKHQSKLNKVTEDPSGIVYEAVLSNPVEGATVKLYTYNPNAAAAGLDEAAFIDSSKFGIEDNPQTTGADGRYQWFVPEGYWQVRVSKKGYEDFSTGDWGHEVERLTYEKQINPETGREEYLPVTDAAGNTVTEKAWVGDYGLDATKDFNHDGVDDASSYWMPVLPVQLDVNIPLVSKEPPKVVSVEGEKEGIIVTFNKYVKPDTVTADLFAVGEEAMQPPAIEPMDAEMAGNGSGEQLARSFRIAYPADYLPPEGADSFPVTFNDEHGVVESYAGVNTAEEDQQVRLDCNVCEEAFIRAPFFLDADPTDKGNHGAEVDWMGRMGISTGWVVEGGREFRGLKDVTRCDFAAFMYRLADLADDGARNDSIKLSDAKVKSVLAGVSDCTPEKTSHAAEVAWLVDSGISKGWPDKGKKTVSFRPMAKVARQDMAAFLYRFADIRDDGQQNRSLEKGPEQITFSDVKHGDESNHAPDVEWLASVGVTKGWGPSSDNKYQFRGTRTVARQDMAAFMKRLYDYLS